MAVRMVGRLDRRADLVAGFVRGNSRTEVLQALLDVVAGEVGADVLVVRAVPSHDRQKPAAGRVGIALRAGAVRGARDESSRDTHSNHAETRGSHGAECTPAAGGP